MMKNILVVNDDGIDAGYIKILASHMQRYGNVYVVAPYSHQSAQGHGITIYEGIKVEEVKNYLPGITAYAVYGKPADCTRIGIGTLGVDFDLVVSGINIGPNLGTDVLYSGTVAAATEGSILGVPSIALSAHKHSQQLVENRLGKVIDVIIEKQMLHKDVVLNVNFPHPEFETDLGIKITTQGERLHDATFHLRNGLYHSVPNLRFVDKTADSDVLAYHQGYISITPLQIDRTDLAYFHHLKSVF